MKAKLVIENIKFERGKSPVRSLEIGRYADIYREFDEKGLVDQDIQDTIKMLTSMAEHIVKTGDSWKPDKTLFKILTHYSKDSYHTDKIHYVEEMLWDIAFDGWKHLSEEEFMKWVYEYTQKVDYQPTTLMDTIRGLYYAVHGELEKYM